MLVNALVIEHARTVTVIITWMYKWKWNWYVDNEVYVWRAREGYVTALSAASHACVDCPARTDEESMNKLRTIAATSSVGPNEGSSVRGTDGSWTRWIEIWIINSLDRCFNSRSGTVGNDRTDTGVVVAPEVGEISGFETIPIVDEDDHGHEHGPMQWIRRCSSSFNLCMHRPS